MEQVLQYFGLSEPPFTLSPNPRYLYLTPQHQTVIYQCQYTIEQRQGLAVVYGDIGTGKTTVARHIYEKYAEDKAYNVAMMISPDLKTDTAFLRGIMAEYGVPTKRSHAASLAAFRRFVVSEFQAGRNIVLMVDESQQMTAKMLEVVRVLLNFETNDKKLIQIILFGQNELALTIDASRAIKSRVSVFGSLASLTDSITMDMIDFRWKAAGGTEQPFPFETVQTIFNISGGLPREIIKLCNLSLTRAFINQKKVVHHSMVVAAAKELRMKEESNGK